MVISSLENEKVKYLVKLKSKKYRDLTNSFIVEGEHLVSEVVKAGIVSTIYTVEGYPYDGSVVLSYDVMKKITNLDSVPNIIALCHKSDNNEIIGNRVVVLDGIQDPGNLGTIIRSSLAFDVSTIVLSPTCVDLYNPKVLRATQGMFCHINIVVRNTCDVINYMKSNSITVYGTSVVDGVDISLLDREERKSFCLIMGNEGSGLSGEILDMCDKNLYIKMSDKVESLNVGVACSILLYEFGLK